MKRIPFLVLAMAILSGCSMNTNPPDYIKQFTVYKEGDGIIIYFILADKSGQMTTYDGEANIEVRTTPTDFDEIRRAEKNFAEDVGIGVDYLSKEARKQALRKVENVVFKQEYAIRKEDFVKTRIGRGMLQQDVIIYSLGRIPYPSPESVKGRKGIAELVYIAKAAPDVESREFTAEETFYF